MLGISPISMPLSFQPSPLSLSSLNFICKPRSKVMDRRTMGAWWSITDWRVELNRSLTADKSSLSSELIHAEFSKSEENLSMQIALLFRNNDKTLANNTSPDAHIKSTRIHENSTNRQMKMWINTWISVPVKGKRHYFEITFRIRDDYFCTIKKEVPSS